VQVPVTCRQSTGTNAQQTTTAQCGHCHRTWRLAVTLTLIDTSQGCGTNAGYARHHRRNEDACPACKDAHKINRQNNRPTRAKKANHP
jgi:hypothetical protein